MIDSPYRQLTFSRIIDRSFRIYRDHYAKLVLLALMLFGPFYLFYLWFLANTGETDRITASIRRELGESNISMAADRYSGDWGPILLLLLVAFPLVIHVIVPAAFSAVTHMVQSIYDREEPSIGAALKKTFRRFWPLYGNSLLFSLIMAGIYLVTIFGVVIVLAIFTRILAFGGGSLLDGDIGPMFVLVTVVVYLAVSFLVYALFTLFLVRFGFYIPAVVMDRDGIGFGRSWRMTGRNFWRTFFVQMVVMLVTMAFYLTASVLAEWLVPFMLIKFIIPSLILLTLIPLQMVAYGVSYMDLKVRREGLDLEKTLDSFLYAESYAGGAAVRETLQYE